MTRIRNWTFGLVAALAALPALALNLGPAAASYDGVYYVSQYPDGDKPVASCTPPTGYTEANKQDGGGEICEQSSTEWDFNVSGTGPRAKFHYAYKDGGSGDIQIKWRNVGGYTGNLGGSTALGAGITDGTGAADFWHECFAQYSGAPVVRCTSGTSAADLVVADGDPASTLPRYYCVTFDQSAGVTKGFASSDGSAWTEVNSVDHAFPDPQVFFFGSSGSATATMQGTLDNIDVDLGPGSITCYTPSDPPGGSPPTVSDIPNQSVTQGTAHSLTFSSYFTGATSYSVSGQPGAGGLSESSDGVFSGTPDSDDLAASPFTVQFCGSNVDGQTCDSSQYNVAPPAGSGDIFTIPTSSTTRTFNCGISAGAPSQTSTTWASIRTSGSASTPGPGDTIRLNSGTHGRIEFINCQGSSSSYLTISNDTTDSAQAIIASSGSTLAYLLCTDCHFVDMTGLGKWSGAPAGTCGITVSSGHTEGTTQCGIKVRTTGAWPTTLVRFNGDSSDYKIQGIEFDGSSGNGTGGSGIGLALQDPVKYTSYNNSNPYTGPWRENILIANNYLHAILKECMYLGPNGYEQELPIRNITVEKNLLDTCGRAGIQGKYWLSGTNYLRYNHVDSTGTLDPSDAGHDLGIGAIDGGNVEIYGNVVLNAGGSALVCNNQNTTTGTNAANSPAPQGFQGPYSCKIYNNIAAHPGALDGVGGFSHPDKCANISVGTSNHPGPRADLNPGYIYNNTFIDCSGGSIGTEVATRIARNNLCGGTTACASPSTSNNRSDTVANLKFVNSASDNYELLGTSPACNQSGNEDSLSLDYEGESRPQDSANDQGADESTACP